ncbi:MBL fold metallo-hydrolase [Deefgea sp. CFH1-16]|uniref:MBL fold metallo-hydrolase n=1 Tax=Deefgea sp. CFH1-16 TaxID=2675457 RepID=UPI0015F48708|nr:MBL fold metallo-hydrolase [Deefgea sp. CFH1-16]MBM5574418.1 MBL fold metallo-hydrolase [Deefgea sp. CFH1-16]
MLRTTLLASTLALSFNVAQAQDSVKAPLQLKVYNADATSFHVNSVLISGEKEAVLIDSGFTRADALRIGANVLDSGKQLTTILISQADPDYYYFGVEVLKNMFPQAQVVATPAVLAKISSKLAGKVAFWGPKMGANAPKNPVLPQPLQGNTLMLEGETIEIRGNTGILAHRPYVWIPSIKTIAGNIGVFGGLHVWTADTQTAAERSAWQAQLNEMAALQAVTVIPGHMQAGSLLDASQIKYTQQYLQRFETNAASAKNSGELIRSMQSAYPQAGMGMALEIGAKVNQGEMKW